MNIQDIQKILRKFTKNNILVVCRSGFKEKLTFYIQNLIPVGNLQ